MSEESTAEKSTESEAPALQEVTDQPEYTAQGAGPEQPAHASRPDDQDSSDVLNEGGFKALQAWKSRAKDAEKEAKGLRSLRGQLAESRKETEQARSESEANATKALRYEVAAEKGIPLELASRLTGSTKEELAEDAEKLKGFIPSSTPREAFSLDRKQDPEAKHSPNDLIRAALKRT